MAVVEGDLAFLGVVESTDAVEETSFASSVGADDGGDIALLHFKADVT